ncbi:MAG: BREX-3 system P-loop-containing protein BrxF [Anaerolineales bacterium]
MSPDLRSAQITNRILLAVQAGTQLVLVVSEKVHALESIGMELVRQSGWPLFHLGRNISQKMVEQQLPCTPELIQDSLLSLTRTSSAVVVTEIDLLFEPIFHLDPLQIFYKISRYVPLVVFWPGRYQHAILTYAVPEHAHYREWRTLPSEIQITPID